jgi:DNA end-binding protein Ku
MTGEFEPEKYHDEYREALMQVIEAKVEGHAPAAPAPVEETGNLVDLMAALEASVKASKAARAGDKPVSVTEAKKARAERADGKKPAARGKKAADDDAEEAETAAAGKSRRRKSA